MENGLPVLPGVVFAFGAVRARGRCASLLSQTPEDHAGGRAGQFHLRRHLNGPMLCEGVICDPPGRVTSRFEAACDGGHVLGVVDRMYLAPDGSIINRSQFRRFGFKVAELVATMRPNHTEERRAA